MHLRTANTKRQQTALRADRFLVKNNYQPFINRQKIFSLEQLLSYEMEQELTHLSYEMEQESVCLSYGMEQKLFFLSYEMEQIFADFTYKMRQGIA